MELNINTEKKNALNDEYKKRFTKNIRKKKKKRKKNSLFLEKE
jgi:hypothetical protein